MSKGAALAIEGCLTFVEINTWKLPIPTSCGGRATVAFEDLFISLLYHMPATISDDSVPSSECLREACERLSSCQSARWDRSNGSCSCTSWVAAPSFHYASPSFSFMRTSLFPYETPPNSLRQMTLQRSKEMETRTRPSSLERTRWLRSFNGSTNLTSQLDTLQCAESMFQEVLMESHRTNCRLRAKSWRRSHPASIKTCTGAYSIGLKSHPSSPTRTVQGGRLNEPTTSSTSF